MTNVEAHRMSLLSALIPGEAYGLEIIERLKAAGVRRSIPYAGWVYPGLRELERAGMVTSRESEPMAERGGRPRRYYRLTESVRALLPESEAR